MKTTTKSPLIAIAAVLLLGCAGQKKSSPAASIKGDTRTVEVELLDDNTFYLTEKSEDKTYGYKRPTR